jgi:Replication initiation factor
LLTLTLDWFAITHKELSHEAIAWFARYASLEKSTPERPSNGYDTCFRTEDGVVHSWHSSRPEMGWHTVFSGSALRNIFARDGVSQRTFLEEALHSGGRVSRLDLAKDAQDVQINLEKIWFYIETKQYSGTARNASKMQSLDGGYTIYVGSRQSEKFIRIYDKASQLGVSDVQWKRYEIETKGMVSRAMAHLLTTEPSWEGAFNEMAQGMLSIPQSTDYQVFFDDTDTRVGIPKLEKVSDREKWILDQCLPAIVRHYTENRTSEAVALLRRALDLIDTVKDLAANG